MKVLCWNQVSMSISLSKIYDQNSFSGSSYDKKNKNGEHFLL